MSLQRFHVELRSASVEGNTLAGHAAVFGQVARIGGHYEQLARSAFDEVLRTSDTVFLFNHDLNQVLGRQSSGTLQLRADDVGLAFEVDLPDTAAGRDVRELVRRGDLKGGSFGFLPGEDKWERTSDGLQLRTHTSIAMLRDASVVTFPAYSDTAVSLRSIDLSVSPTGRSQLIKARARTRKVGSPS
jgi:HK97 family phage prohead protease